MAKATVEDVEKLDKRFGLIFPEGWCWENSVRNVLNIDYQLDKKCVDISRWPLIYKIRVDDPMDEGFSDEHDYVVFDGKVYNRGVTWPNKDYRDFTLEDLAVLEKWNMGWEVTAKRLEDELNQYHPHVPTEIELFGKNIPFVANEKRIDPSIIETAAEKHLRWLKNRPRK